MSILARYVLKEHLAPFLFAFVTITFLLIIEQVPRIIDSVIDKNLSPRIVLELIGLNLAWMLALSVPMSVLVATLMAFGRLTADLETTAMKACGVNLLRILIPLLFVALLISGGMVLFNDRVLPDLNKRARVLMGDISAMRPTLIFRSGMFVSDVPGYLILIDRVDHLTSRVEGVRITETKTASRPRVIVADSGYLKMIDDGRTMQFTLYSGEVHTFDTENPTDYRTLLFHDQVINIGGTSSELVRSESEYRTDREMNIIAMRDRITESRALARPFEERIATSLQERTAVLLADSAYATRAGKFSDSEAFVLTRTDATALAGLVARNYEQVESQQRIMDKFEIEIHKKFAIPTASLAFVLIGAPLGILTRRGGMGIAITVSILLFIVYWAFLIGGEDMADRGLVPPFWAMWSANILLAGIGLYLLYIVVTEKPLFGSLRRLVRPDL